MLFSMHCAIGYKYTTAMDNIEVYVTAQYNKILYNKILNVTVL